ncbi:MAG: hypothetical protein F6J90_32775 [Moorea sp. SIOASIH]|nr:hypothetical protein [Moorena sp. SIOASIH]
MVGLPTALLGAFLFSRHTHESEFRPSEYRSLDGALLFCLPCQTQNEFFLDDLVVLEVSAFAVPVEFLRVLSFSLRRLIMSVDGGFDDVWLSLPRITLSRATSVSSALIILTNSSVDNWLSSSSVCLGCTGFFMITTFLLS